jgi:hypothetical protein
MKFVFTLTIALSCALLSSHAQINVGAKAGVNFNSFRSSDAYSNYFDVIPGFHIGGYAKYSVFDFLTARAELNYFQQGANLFDYALLSDLYRKDVEVRFHNLQVPILAEFHLPSLALDPVKPKIMLGVFYSYTVAARESFVNVASVSGNTKIEYDGSSDVGDQFTKSQYGLIAALAAELKMFGRYVELEVRYHYNVPRANKPGSQADVNLERTAASWGNDLRLQSLSISLGMNVSQF